MVFRHQAISVNTSGIVSTSFIDTHIYCFRTGLPISMSKDVSIFAILCKTVNLTVQMFEIKPKSEEITNFFLTFL